MIGYLLIGVLILTMVFVMGLISLSNTTGDWAVILVVMLLCVGISFIIQYHKEIPSAMGVYRGNTELQITYQGKLPIDSVVIYKKGGKK